MTRFFAHIVFGIFFVFTSSCVASSPALVMGVQPRYEAVNPSRILAVPLFFIPDPSRGDAKIDQSAAEGGALVSNVEGAVIDAFTGQPAVNGVPFNSVRRELGKSSVLLTNLESELAKTSKNLASREPQNLSNFSRQCINRKNFVEFYAYCVAPTKAWKDQLNALSAKLFNSDSALFVVITQSEKRVTAGRYESALGIAVLLVDTNNANLIWGRAVNETTRAEGNEKSFPEWKTMVPKLLDASFWETFPGRKLTK